MKAPEDTVLHTGQPILVNPNPHLGWPMVLPAEMTAGSPEAIEWRYRMYASSRAYVREMKKAQRTAAR